MEIDNNTPDVMRLLIAAAKKKGLSGKILRIAACWDSDMQEWDKPEPNGWLTIAQIGDTIAVMDDADGRAVGLTLTGPAKQVKIIKSLWARLWDDENDDSDD